MCLRYRRRTARVASSITLLGAVFACGETNDPLNDGNSSGGASGSGGHAGQSRGGMASRGGSPAGASGGSGAPEGGAGEADGEAGGAGERSGPPCDFEVVASISPRISTVGIVEWSTDLDWLDTAHVDFGLDSDYGMRAPVDLAEPAFRTLLLGMKSSRTYHFRIAAEGPSGSCTSDDFTLETGPLPDELPRVNVVRNAGTPAGGFLISGFLVDGPAFVLDADGDYVWWYGSGPMGRVLPSHDGHHLWFSAVNVDGGNASMKRVTMDGLSEDDFTAEFEELHHDFTVLPDETIAFIRHDGERDLVVARAPDGTLTTVIDLPSAHGGSTRNHANSIRYRTEDDSYTISDLSQNAYVKVTRAGDVTWVLGGATSHFTGDGAAWEAQHGHHVLADDRFLFFSNGPVQGPSEVIEVSLDLRAMTATRVFSYVSGQRSLIFGDVERLANGNTLVTYSTAGRIHEVNADGELVHELSWEPQSAVGYVTKRASLYGRPGE
jgi:hypothetical protein